VATAEFDKLFAVVDADLGDELNDNEPLCVVHMAPGSVLTPSLTSCLILFLRFKQPP
jgi:hypothetical protein